MSTRGDAVRPRFPEISAMTNPEQNAPSQAQQMLLEESIVNVREALSGLKFGNVSLTVHEGRVVQIDVTEKKRLKPN
jgi:hypothetical protein